MTTATSTKCTGDVRLKQPDLSIDVTFGNPASWIAIVWNALDEVDFEKYPSDWDDDVKTAMAWISEELGVETGADAPY